MQWHLAPMPSLSSSTMPADPVAPDLDAVSTALRGYLARHPAAADTVEGIQRWWLADVLGEVSPALVEVALERLEDEGVVVRRQHPGLSKVTWAGAAPDDRRAV